MYETKLRLSILLLTCMAFQPAASYAKFAGGTGEPNDPYQIATAEQLLSIGSDPAMMDKHFVLLNDIDLDPNLPGGQVFDGVVIAKSYSSLFVGILNGNGHKILNLNIESDSLCGLIGYLGPEGGVHDLGLMDVHISGAKGGALVVTNHGSIRNCFSTGTIEGRSDTGGLVGENRGYMTECYSACVVTGSNAVGGLVGRSREGSISMSYATGSINGDSKIGGLLGEASDASVFRCYATGAVSGSMEVGGLIGHTSRSTLVYCYAGGSVNGDNFVGGLVGNAWTASVGWCYSTGSVTGAEPIGGLVGSSIQNVYSSFFLSPDEGGGPDNGYGTALTHGQMTLQASFSGWRFYSEGPDSEWFMPLDGPPVLVWQTEITGLSAVPEVARMPWNEAESFLTNAGFIIGAVNYDYDRTIPADHVVLVRPAAYAPPGSTLDVILSNGNYNWQDNPGSGSPEEPYQLSSPGQLESLAGSPDLWDKHFFLTNEINLAGRIYQNSLIDAFNGSFDGKGFPISHLTIMPEATNEFGYVRSDLGLFGRIGPEGKIYNLRLADVQVSILQVGPRVRGRIGALAVENEGTISDCSVTGNIVGSTENDDVGGLIGVNNGKIDNSYVGPGTVSGNNGVGGLVGQNSEGTIENCYSVMAVDGAREVGGLIGQNREGTVISSYAAGPLKADIEHHHGGLIGISWLDEGIVKDCFWDVESTGQVRGGGGMGLTTSEMMDAGIYALNGWAGNTAWTIDDGVDYPRLAWEGKAGTNIPQPVVDWLEGDGTEDSPYIITTAEQLGRISTATVILDKNFVLTADIDLEGIEWRPIGISSGTRFDGVFDGNGHTISNLTIGTPEGLMYPSMAFFGYTGQKATIRDVVLTNATVLGSHDGEWTSALVASNLGKIKDCHVEALLTGEFCGGLAGKNGGLILYCTSTSSITDERGLRKVGVLVGENDGGAIFACRAKGSITCGSESAYVGGAVGNNYWRSAIVACSADVAVTCGDKCDRVGGLVGFDWGTAIVNSQASGAIAVGDQCENIGGLVGETWSDVVNCYASGAVITGQQIVDSGGLSGSLGTTGRVTRSYFLSPADGGGPDNGIGTWLTDQQMRQQTSFGGWDFDAGSEDGTADFWSMPDDGGYPALNILSGYQPPVVVGSGTTDDPYLIDSAEQIGFAARNPDACYRLTADLDLSSIVWPTAAIPLLYGDFDGNGHIVRNLTINGGSFTGLIGTISEQASVVDLGIFDADITGSERCERIAVMAALNKGTISRCAVTGKVTGDERVGGLVGEHRGQIYDCYATCDVAGNLRIGGLVGENHGDVTTSYVNGDVSGPDDQWGIGAFVGYSYDGTFTNCLWERREGMKTTTDRCQALTSTQIKDAEVLGLNGWAENSSWVIDNGKDYPRLAWEATAGVPIPVPTIDWLAGTGTAEAPYEIQTVNQLGLLSVASVLWDKHFVLTSDLDCTGLELGRIGVCPGTGFSGHFDGAYHSIKNVTLGSKAPNHEYLGLFGFVDEGGSVTGVVLDNVQISCGAFSGPVGALVGENHGHITNCGVTGSLTSGDGSWVIGGLAGGNEGVIETCHSDVAVSTGDEVGSIGGLAGANDGQIANSYASGFVQAGLRIENLGGLAGRSGGYLLNCYSSNEVSRKSASPTSYPEMGGLVGVESSGSVIASCYYLGRNNNLGIQLSEEQMKNQASFVGWDFVGETANGSEDIWRILEGQDYPQLNWESAN